MAEKKVKSILNKMTKEKFDKLSSQMIEIPIISSEILTMIIENIYDKAVDEPSFGDMYADLCYRLSQSAKVANFVHVIESDEEPPTEDGSPSSGESSTHTVYRWSNDVSTTDEDIVGPFSSEEECFDVALSEEDDDEPIQRGDMELELVSVSIRRGIFVKIMKKKGAEPGEENIYYTVYFPVEEAEECGQQLSEIFLSHIECEQDSKKKNSFKRSLLNKCEEEFNKQDIYADWKKEKAAYEEKKTTMTDAERAETEEELEFRRIRIKKQMLGNVKFIGQLYKKGLLKEKIMRFCIASLLELEITTEPSAKVPEYRDPGKNDMDEEDHEAICNIFTTIGATIDTPAASSFMTVCFNKIEHLSTSKKLPSRSRFMYKDLLDLRANKWVPRRKVEKAKTLEEIRKDVEKEERRQAQQSMRTSGRGGYGGRGDRGDSRGRSSMAGGGGGGGANRQRQTKPSNEPDDDGFTTIGNKSNFTSQRDRGPKTIQSRPKEPVAAAASKFGALSIEEERPASPKVEGLSDDQVKSIVNRMRSDFMSTGGNVEEVHLSWKEISGTEGAGRTLITTNLDKMMDAKDSERRAAISIASILFEDGKLTTSDIQEGSSEVIEFIDSMVMDSPLAYEYLGEFLAEMLRIHAVDMAWICEELEKTKADPGAKAPEKVSKATLSFLKKKAGPDAVQSVLSESQPALTKLLGADLLSSVSQSL